MPLRRTDAVLVAVVAGAYFAAARLGLSLATSSPAEQVTLVWPPTGIALAAVVLFGYRALPGVAAGAFLANVTAPGETTATALSIAAGNTAEAAVGAWLLSRVVGFQASLLRVRDVVGLLVAAAGAATIAATVGAASLCIGDVHPWSAHATLWRTWWIGDAMGALIFAPVIFAWSDVVRLRVHRRGAVEATLLAALLVVACLVVYCGELPLATRNQPIEYVAFPFLIWAALRFGQRGTTAVTCVVAIVAISGAVHGAGPFVSGTLHERLTLLQLFLCVMATTGLVLGAAMGERDRAQASLKESETRFRQLAEAIPSIVWSASPDGTIRYVNRRWIEFCGGAAAGDGRPPELIVHPEDRDRCAKAWEDAVRREAPYEVEVRHRRHDGEFRWFIARAVPTRDAEGRVDSWIGVTADIHEHKSMEERLLDADRRKNEFLATLAHELRGPLSSLGNALQVLEMAEGGGDGPPSEPLTIAQRQLAGMVRLVDDLMDVSRITRGKVTLRPGRVPLAEVVARAVETSRPLIEECGGELTVDLPSESVWMDVDATRIAQVVGNLLNNAAKYGERGGRIRLTASVERIADRPAPYLVLTVSDDGIGIAPDLLPHVFDPFVQAPRSMPRSRGGLGIGLTLVRRLVEMHGGAVEAHSEGVGKGSQFVVRLPLPEQRAATDGASETAVARGAAPGRRVLVVDDNRDSAATMTMLLRKMGYDVRTAYDGAEAVEVAAAMQPDIVLLDIGLPKLDGHEAARRIREAPWGRSVLLVAITGWGQEDDRRRSREAGFDHHLVKPVDGKALMRVLAGARHE